MGRSLLRTNLGRRKLQRPPLCKRFCSCCGGGDHKPLPRVKFCRPFRPKWNNGGNKKSVRNNEKVVQTKPPKYSFKYECNDFNRDDFPRVTVSIERLSDAVLQCLSERESVLVYSNNDKNVGNSFHLKSASDSDSVSPTRRLRSTPVLPVKRQIPSCSMDELRELSSDWRGSECPLSVNKSEVPYISGTTKNRPEYNMKTLFLENLSICQRSQNVCSKENSKALQGGFVVGFPVSPRKAQQPGERTLLPKPPLENDVSLSLKASQFVTPSASSILHPPKVQGALQTRVCLEFKKKFRSLLPAAPVKSPKPASRDSASVAVQKIGKVLEPTVSNISSKPAKQAQQCEKVTEPPVSRLSSTPNTSRIQSHESNGAVFSTRRNLRTTILRSSRLAPSIKVMRNEFKPAQVIVPPTRRVPTKSNNPLVNTSADEKNVTNLQVSDSKHAARNALPRGVKPVVGRRKQTLTCLVSSLADIEIPAEGVDSRFSNSLNEDNAEKISGIVQKKALEVSPSLTKRRKISYETHDDCESTQPQCELSSPRTESSNGFYTILVSDSSDAECSSINRKPVSSAKSKTRKDLRNNSKKRYRGNQKRKQVVRRTTENVKDPKSERKNWREVKNKTTPSQRCKSCPGCQDDAPKRTAGSSRFHKKVETKQTEKHFTVQRSQNSPTFGTVEPRIAIIHNLTSSDSSESSSDEVFPDELKRDGVKLVVVTRNKVESSYDSLGCKAEENPVLQRNSLSCKTIRTTADDWSPVDSTVPEPLCSGVESDSSEQMEMAVSTGCSASTDASLRASAKDVIPVDDLKLPDDSSGLSYITTTVEVTNELTVLEFAPVTDTECQQKDIVHTNSDKGCNYSNYESDRSNNPIVFDFSGAFNVMNGDDREADSPSKFAGPSHDNKVLSEGHDSSENTCLDKRSASNSSSFGLDVCKNSCELGSICVENRQPPAKSTEKLPLEYHVESDLEKHRVTENREVAHWAFKEEISSEDNEGLLGSTKNEIVFGLHGSPLCESPSRSETGGIEQDMRKGRFNRGAPMEQDIIDTTVSSIQSKPSPNIVDKEGCCSHQSNKTLGLLPKIAHSMQDDLEVVSPSLHEDGGTDNSCAPRETNHDDIVYLGSSALQSQPLDVPQLELNRTIRKGSMHEETEGDALSTTEDQAPKDDLSSKDGLNYQIIQDPAMNSACMEEEQKNGTATKPEFLSSLVETMGLGCQELTIRKINLQFAKEESKANDDMIVPQDDLESIVQSLNIPIPLNSRLTIKKLTITSRENELTPKEPDSTSQNLPYISCPDQNIPIHQSPPNTPTSKSLYDLKGFPTPIKKLNPEVVSVRKLNDLEIDNDEPPLNEPPELDRVECVSSAGVRFDVRPDDLSLIENILKAKSASELNDELDQIDGNILSSSNPNNSALDVSLDDLVIDNDEPPLNPYPAIDMKSPLQFENDEDAEDLVIDNDAPPLNECVEVHFGSKPNLNDDCLIISSDDEVDMSGQLLSTRMIDSVSCVPDVPKPPRKNILKKRGRRVKGLKNAIPKNVLSNSTLESQLSGNNWQQLPPFQSCREVLFQPQVFPLKGQPGLKFDFSGPSSQNFIGIAGHSCVERNVNSFAGAAVTHGGNFSGNPLETSCLSISDCDTLRSESESEVEVVSPKEKFDSNVNKKVNCNLEEGCNSDDDVILIGSPKSTAGWQCQNSGPPNPIVPVNAEIPPIECIDLCGQESETQRDPVVPLLPTPSIVTLPRPVAQVRAVPTLNGGYCYVLAVTPTFNYS